MLFSAAVLAALPFVRAAPSPWQPADSPAHNLFRRQDPGAPFDASKYPPVGAIPTNIPQEWLDKLKSVQIANVPVATDVPGTDNQVTYPTGTDLQSKEVCAYSTGCLRDDDIWSLPEGVFGITFDDGPGEGTQTLSDFLESKSLSAHATHFFIGGQITRLPELFKLIFDRGGHIAGHTWSHPRLTSRTNEEIVAELGWTMQIIYDLSDGRIPQFWRPPFGDLDERVRDVAKNVFGLKTVLWNSDTNDWKIAAEGKQVVEVLFDQWANGPKAPGHNVLMHEIRLPTIEVFISKFDAIASQGWKIQNIAESVGEQMYANAADNKAEVTPMTLIEAAGAAPPPAASSAGTSPSAGAPSGAASSAGSAAGPSASVSAPATGNEAVTPPKSSASRLAPGFAISAVILVAALI